MEGTALVIGFVLALAMVELWRIAYRAGYLAARENVRISGNAKMLNEWAPRSAFMSRTTEQEAEIAEARAERSLILNGYGR